jgi:hypothetical protein
MVAATFHDLWAKNFAVALPIPLLAPVMTMVFMMHLFVSVGELSTPDVMAALEDLKLNLLKAPDALVTDESVNRAVERAGVTQPATSQALARLHRTIDDIGLVRVGRA